MFDIAKIASSVNNIQPGILSRALQDVLPAMRKVEGEMGGLLGTLAKAAGGAPSGPFGGVAQELAQQLAGAAAQAGPLPAANLDRLPAALTKVMYISILLQAVEEARGKQHFNVETAINDLWVKLAKVRPSQNQAMQQTLQKTADLMKQISGMMQHQQGMMRGAIRNIK